MNIPYATHQGCCVQGHRKGTVQYSYHALIKFFIYPHLVTSFKSANSVELSTVNPKQNLVLRGPCDQWKICVTYATLTTPNPLYRGEESGSALLVHHTEMNRLVRILYCIPRESIYSQNICKVGLNISQLRYARLCFFFIHIFDLHFVQAGRLCERFANGYVFESTVQS